ncbi:baseplate J/gp47 family protein [Brevibacillus brevis]|uniref:baseplate J/gp47 family protein n=1 Tax=Brevibacillus brevis TaxID=1393 RepID=UPI00363F956B
MGKVSQYPSGDVNVSSPRAGVVEIRPLLKTGEIPDQTILDQVAAVCNDRKIRPLTDQVFVLAPTQKTYNIEATYWIDTDKESAVTTIQANVNKAVAAINFGKEPNLAVTLIHPSLFSQ